MEGTDRSQRRGPVFASPALTAFLLWVQTGRQTRRHLKNEGNDLFPSLQQTDKTEDVSNSSLTDTGLIDKTTFTS